MESILIGFQLTSSRSHDRAKQVGNELQDTGILVPDTILVIHAGRAYYEELLSILDAYNVSIEIPTEGLMLGETLSWYNAYI